MCHWSYSHHHHLPPCTQPIEMVVNYNYCQDAVADPVTGEVMPCKYTYFGDDAAMINQVDYDDPCATGGCLISPACESGVCRLAQLGGRWACCRCGGRGNEYRWCQHRLRASPDTFCYHVCCDACRPDPRGSDRDSDPTATPGLRSPAPPPPTTTTTTTTPATTTTAYAAAGCLSSPGFSSSSSSSSASSKKPKRR
ncbi:hypothetical protein MYCTH_2057234 [Thermothelomyces thermophilus ATCC 42464]|uniref:Uncharacterized protein n=1 Tax=Thermothelomyces thermophilus (strain ATCC 42464 / BCRC 31852 / DSM 1799) TaxID=573729 RepID=G2QAK3_THET4|nr:uncharacterized protein MYCTH_2057234 [Thermothelomyces thermophilus ATCC 42464]AEO56699.1 hypothetical protein MYCTH_2057234 [Thermothelomyces thermophilus ATCC 42464]